MNRTPALGKAPVSFGELQLPLDLADQPLFGAPHLLHVGEQVRELLVALCQLQVRERPAARVLRLEDGRALRAQQATLRRMPIRRGSPSARRYARPVP